MVLSIPATDRRVIFSSHPLRHLPALASPHPHKHGSCNPTLLDFLGSRPQIIAGLVNVRLVRTKKLLSRLKYSCSRYHITPLPNRAPSAPLSPRNTVLLKSVGRKHKDNLGYSGPVPHRTRTELWGQAQPSRSRDWGYGGLAQEYLSLVADAAWGVMSCSRLIVLLFGQ